MKVSVLLLLLMVKSTLILSERSDSTHSVMTWKRRRRGLFLHPFQDQTGGLIIEGFISFIIILRWVSTVRFFSSISNNSLSLSLSLMDSKALRRRIAIADAASWYCAIVLVILILLVSIRDENSFLEDQSELMRGSLQFLDRPCDEIYVVGEGETLNTISDKCGDPYIVEQNPHIQDPDDVFPGLVIKISPSKPR